jgi:predicted metal-binding membrane protein
MIIVAARPNQNWAADHPEWWALTCSALAWGTMLTAGPEWHGWLCTAPDGGFLRDIQIAWSAGILRAHLAGWFAMTVAMMPPLAIPLIRHVAVRSFAARRHRAIAVFLAGSLGPWLVVGIVGLPILAVAPVAPLTPSTILAGGGLLAGAWQMTPIKRRALLRCHRTFPLGPAGWRADRDCLHYGFVHGIDCVTSCWPLMLTVIIAAHTPAITLAVQFFTIAERRARHPRLGLSALALAAGSLLIELMAQYG